MNSMYVVYMFPSQFESIRAGGGNVGQTIAATTMCLTNYRNNA